MKKKKLYIVLVLGILLDQLSKLIVIKNLDFAASINIIKNFFRLTYVKNTGAAWSILQNNRFLLIIITIFVLIGLIYYIYKNGKEKDNIIYGLLIGGIIGNLIDRICYGYVIDFLDFNIFGYAFPIFNVADMLIVISIFIMIFKLIKEG